MKHYTTAIIFVAAILISCSDKSTNSNSSVKELKGEKIEIEDDFYGQVVRYADSSNIYLETYTTNYYEEHFKLNGDRWTLVTTYGSKGQGPEEIFANDISITDDGSQLMLYDIMTRKALLYNLESDSCKAKKLDKFNLIPEDYRVSDLVFVNDSILTCRVRYSSYDLPDQQQMVYFGSFNFKNGAFSLINGYSIDDNQNVPYNTKQLVYASCKFVKRPSSDRYAICYSSGQVFEIFDVVNNNVRNRHILKQSYPQYTVSATDGISPKYTDTGICDGLHLESTDDYIYVIPSRYTISELQRIYYDKEKIEKFEGPAKGYQFNETVWLYDWDGNLVNEFVLSPMATSIAVTPDNKYIYGISEDENYEPIILRYETGL